MSERLEEIRRLEEAGWTAERIAESMDLPVDEVLAEMQGDRTCAHGHTPEEECPECITEKEEADLRAPKHTPGPWGVLGSEGNIIHAHADRGMFTVASLEHQSPRGDEKFANAKLISKAPELLEELNLLTKDVGGCWGYAEAYLREVLGNTNYRVVLDRLESARALLKEISR
jgi:hypothetical protein